MHGVAHEKKRRQKNPIPTFPNKGKWGQSNFRPNKPSMKEAKIRVGPSRGMGEGTSLGKNTGTAGTNNLSNRVHEL